MRKVLNALVLISFLLPTVFAAAADAPRAAVPPGEAGAKTALENSPRHHEWAELPLPAAAGKLSLFVAYPERKNKAPVVLVIHEVYELTDWVRAEGPEKFASRDDVVRAVRELTPAVVNAALDAAARNGRTLPAATGKLATVGFCWGGSQSFNYATARPDLDAAVVYYGASPAAAALKAWPSTVEFLGQHLK